MSVRAVVWPGICAFLLACREAAGPGPFGPLVLQETRFPSSLLLTAALGGDSLVYIVVSDTSAAPDTISYGACAFAARIYQGPTFAQLAWQSVPSGGYTCTAVLITTVVPAKDSVRIVAAHLVAQPPGVAAPPPYGQVRSCLNAYGNLIELVAGVRDIARLQAPAAVRRAG